MKITLAQLMSEKYRRSFYDFSLKAFEVLHNGQQMKENWHIKFLCDVLQQEAQRIVSGNPRQKHLLINVPPRTLKSELVNVFFSVYLWVLDDSLKVISSSYSADLSVDLSSKARRVIESDWFIEHFPNVKISPDDNTKSKYTTPNDGLRYTTSTNGTVTGFGGDVIIIDDPQNPKLANSEKERINANNFFNQTLRSRLNNPDHGVFIVIMQRLHEQDLTGMLLELEPNEWQHICLPAELSPNIKPDNLRHFYTDGLLFPQRLNKKVLSGLKLGLGAYGYSGQYEQTPSPSDGGIIKKSWFNIVKEIPAGTVNFFIDTAYTAKSQNDASALLACIYTNNNLYIKEVLEVRMEFPELINEVKRFVSANGYTRQSRVFVEPKASGKSLVQQLRRSTGLNIIEDTPPTEDKLSRATSVSAVIESGRVYLLDGRYCDNFINQVGAFPNAAHDDMVDTLVMALNKFTSRPNKAPKATLTRRR